MHMDPKYMDLRIWTFPYESTHIDRNSLARHIFLHIYNYVHKIIYIHFIAIKIYTFTHININILVFTNVSTHILKLLPVKNSPVYD
jgi:hypothetical protein